MSFPKHIDNSIISSAKSCLTQARYAYIEDLSPPGESVHLQFGAAMAYGLEVGRRSFHDEGFTASEAIEHGAQAAWEMYGDFEPPHKSPKTRAAVRDSIRYYFTIWPLDRDPVQPTRAADGKLRVEWRFKHPLPGLVHPDDGGEIFYVGRSDMIPDLQGMTIVEDDKSASQLGDKWASQWPLDGQFMGYVWAAQQEGILLPNAPGQALIRGLGVYTRKYLKRGTDTQLRKVTPEMVESGEAVYDMMTSFGHAQALVTHAPWQIERWLRETQRMVKRLIYAYINDPDGTKGEWDMALDKASCGAYGGCPYTDLCMSQEPERWKAINFVKRKWDPLSTV